MSPTAKTCPKVRGAPVCSTEEVFSTATLAIACVGVLPPVDGAGAGLGDGDDAEGAGGGGGLLSRPVVSGEALACALPEFPPAPPPHADSRLISAATRTPVRIPDFKDMLFFSLVIAFAASALRQHLGFSRSLTRLTSMNPCW
jgi:hypothetical protein